MYVVITGITIVVGQQSISHTRFVFRLRKCLYRVHPDAIDTYIEELTVVDLDGNSLADDLSDESEISEAGGVMS